jgi:CheY-like chemotaxis protein
MLNASEPPRPQKAWPVFSKCPGFKVPTVPIMTASRPFYIPHRMRSASAAGPDALQPSGGSQPPSFSELHFGACPNRAGLLIPLAGGVEIMTRLLLVEDSEPNRDLITRYLGLFDFEIVQATDGLQAIERVHAESFDLILMDMSLAVLDGWEVSRRLKADDKVRHIPIIALTAHAMVGDREKALAAGCDEYETKPINFQSLIDKINNLVPQKELV